jgi:hypothetical protein
LLGHGRCSINGFHHGSRRFNAPCSQLLHFTDDLQQLLDGAVSFVDMSRVRRPAASQGVSAR